MIGKSIALDDLISWYGRHFQKPHDKMIAGDLYAVI